MILEKLTMRHTLALAISKQGTWPDFVETDIAEGAAEIIGWDKKWSKNQKVLVIDITLDHFSKCKLSYHLFGVLWTVNVL